MNRGRAQDPLLYARFVACATCGQVSYPVDAEWLDSDFLLATYPAACSHVRSFTAVMEVRELIVTTAAADTERFLPRRRCAGHNRFRRPCRAYARPGSDFCAAHGVSAAGPG
jgi:hypothetical protein